MSLLTDEEWTRYLEYQGEHVVLADALRLEEKRMLDNNAQFNYMVKHQMPYNPPASKREEYRAIKRKFVSDINAIDTKYGFLKIFLRLRS